MSSLALKIESLSKLYRLGELNRKTFLTGLLGKLSGKSNDEERPGDFWALRDVSLDIAQGEVVGILGRNGAGKSTMLKIISSITAPTSGSVKLNGRVAALLEVGTGFHQELSGRDNIFLNGAILGMTSDETKKRFDEIVSFSGVEKFIDTPVKRYSSGMRVRLAFAVAAHLEAEILIIDEVLAVGDAAFQQKCMGKMGSVAKTGRTVLFVSHQAAAVEALCNRGIVLESGRVAFDGTQSEALAFYGNRLENTEGNLLQRTDRTGTGAVQVVKVELVTKDGTAAPVVFSGQDIEVRLHFENRSNEPFPELNARISILTELGIPVFTHFNHLTQTMFGSLPERGTLVCKLPALPLNRGRYRLDYRLATRHRGAELLDALEGAMRFSVEGGDYYGTGTLPDPRDGAVLVNGSWNIEKGA